MVARCRRKTSHLADKPIRPPVTWVNKHLLPDFDHTIFPGCPIAQMGFTHMRFFEVLLSNIGHDGHEVEQTMQCFGPFLRRSLVQSTGGDRIRFSATA